MSSPSSETTGLAEPPEGVIAGESIPRENEESDVLDQKRTQVYRTLRARYGGRFSEEQLREKADAIARRGVSDE